LLYFKRAGGDLFTIDLEQLAKVKAFREGLPARGILYRDFNDTADFVGLVNKHIYELIVDEWRDGQWIDISLPALSGPASNSKVAALVGALAPTNEHNAMVTTGEQVADDLDFGLLEYMAAFHAAAERLDEALAEIVSCTERIGERMRSRTSETTALQQEIEQGKRIGGSRAHQDYLRKAREVVDGAASDLDEFVSTMSPAVDAYRSAAREMFENLRRAIDEGAQLATEPPEAEQNRRSLEVLIRAMETGRDGTVAFHGSVRQIPALTGKFKRSRQHAAAILGNLIAELTLGIDEAKELLRGLNGEDNAA
jgi:hypothetical protein